MNYDFDLFFLAGSYPKLLEGLILTLKLTVASNLIGLTMGFVLALMAMSSNPLIRWPTMLFIDFFRCTPALIQVIWFFYCVPIVFNVFMDGLTLGILAIGFNLASFNAEAYRASIQSIPREQTDASIALGLSPLRRSISVILPQAFSASLPVLVANGIGAFQATALVAVVALEDLMYMGKMVAIETYRPIETFTLVALIYLAFSLPVSQLVEYFERRRKAAM